MLSDQNTMWPTRAELAAWVNQSLADQQRAELEAYGEVLTPSVAHNAHERAAKAVKTAVRIVGQKRGANRPRPAITMPPTSRSAAMSGRLTTDELRDLIMQAEQQVRDQAVQHPAPQAIRWEDLSHAQLAQLAACHTHADVDKVLARWSTQHKGV